MTQNQLFIRDMDKLYSFITSWDLLALYPLLTIFVGGLLSIILFSERTDNVPSVSKSFKRIKKLGMLIIIIFCYMIFRYVGIMLTFLNMKNVNVFWRLDIMVLSILPLTFLSAKFIKFDQINHVSLPALNWNRQACLTVCLTAMLIFSITGFFGFHDPGIRKGGRILIDEGHSDWEWTTRKFDTEWYGQQSTYNYYCLAEYLKCFYQVAQKTETLTENVLKDYDILLLKTPTEPFSNNEIEAIKIFVKNGGGLFLIGDHTNVFGITTNLNPIATKFDLRFNYDGQYDISGELSVYRRPKILPHPAVQRMPAFLFATGCTIEAPLSADHIIIGTGLKSIYLDYSQKNFFPRNAAQEETLEFGLFLQAAGTRLGKGRILGFTDSTVWSNFYMFMPGKPGLLLGCIDWLNRENSVLSHLRIIFLVLALISLALLTFLNLKTREKALIPISLFSGMLAVSLSIFFFQRINKVFYPPPKAIKEFIQVNFDYEHTDFELPILHITQNANRSYSTFFTWLQRLQYVPKVCYNFKEALTDGDAVVIIKPRKPFQKDEIASLMKYIDSGGKVLIIVDPMEQENFAASQILSPLQMAIKTAPFKNSAILYRDHESDSLRFTTSNAGEVISGQTLLWADTSAQMQRRNEDKISLNSRAILHLPESDFLAPIENREPWLPKSGAETNKPDSSKHTKGPYLKKIPVFASHKLGKGMVAVLACADLFTDAQMGFGSAIPNQNMKNIYEFEYWIFRELFKLGN